MRAPLFCKRVMLFRHGSCEPYTLGGFWGRLRRPQNPPWGGVEGPSAPPHLPKPHYAPQCYLRAFPRSSKLRPIAIRPSVAKSGALLARPSAAPVVGSLIGVAGVAV